MIPEYQYREMLGRLEGSRSRSPNFEPLKPCTVERVLHDEIIEWCNEQRPRVKYIHARMDRKSTINKGANDFTLFLHHGKTLCIECKRENEKQDKEQLMWAAEMRMLDHEVHVVRSIEEFLKLVSEKR